MCNKCHWKSNECNDFTVTHTNSKILKKMFIFVWIFSTKYQCIFSNYVWLQIYLKAARWFWTMIADSVLKKIILLSARALFNLKHCTVWEWHTLNFVRFFQDCHIRRRFDNFSNSQIYEITPIQLYLGSTFKLNFRILAKSNYNSK